MHRRQHSTVSLRALACVLSVFALIVGACNSTAPTPSVSASAASTPSTSPVTSPPSAASSPSPSVETAVYEAINRQVQAIRGLDERTPVTPTLVSGDQLASVARAEIAADNPPAVLAAEERLDKAMGLLAPDASLSALLDKLTGTQAAGLYDPSSKHLYVLSKAGQVGPVEKLYYSHEYDHALQDQHFGLKAFMQGLQDDSDAGLARQALVEGDAYVTMTLWMQQNLGPTDMAAVLAAGLDPTAANALASIPRIVQAQLLFAATQGLQFVFRLETSGGWAAVNQAWAHPPRSTEQILHPDKYASDEAPVAVSLPAGLAARMGAGWSVEATDTLGEYQIGIWLGDVGKLDQATSTTDAAGWGGDRIELLQGPSGAWALAFESAWDTPGDASEFEQGAGSIVGTLRASGDSAQVLPGAGGLVRWIVAASDASTLSKLATTLGLAG